MQLLRVDSSARSRSVTRQLTEAFRDAWRRQHPTGTVVERDLAATALPHITDEWSGTFGPPDQLTPAQRAYLTLSDALTGEFLTSDMILVGAPMYNFSVSWELKAWIDQIVRLGKTVGHGSRGLTGLAGGRQVVVVTARGGDYSARSTRARFDHQEPYLRDIFAFVGITDIQFIHADRQLSADAATVRAEALAATRRSAAT